MATIKPFKCIRPRQDVADRVAALPYDVYNRSEAKVEVAREPLSFLKIDRAETQFDDSVDTYDSRVYDKARELLDGMIEDGIYEQDADVAYYVYEQTMDGRAQTGIVACSSVDDYLNQVIKKHENTREDKEIDRINHVDRCNAQTGPIFLAYRSNAVINEVVNRYKKTTPVYDFTSVDGIKHVVWKIADTADTTAVEEAFSAIDSIYIADGHHRAASAVKVGLKRRDENPGYMGDEEFNSFLSVLFPHDELMIMDYNRTVKDLNGLSKEEFIEKLKEHFNIIDVTAKEVKPEKKGQFTMYLDNEWYVCEINDELKAITDPVASLDVSLLQDYLLAPVLGIGDPRTDKRIDFIGGIRGLSELKKRADSDMKVSFAMYPTSIEELFDVADAGMLMPPKSTWFEPKLRSGLFIHRLS
ncbi:MAG: DUF1015 domain-containing protein [Lachnospiraceae bacterium]|nr:DUF1015 domain-containing protein [Lachnospiraceae bacterium]